MKSRVFARAAALLKQRSVSAYGYLVTAIGSTIIVALDVPPSVRLPDILVAVLHRGALVLLAGLAVAIFLSSGEKQYRRLLATHAALTVGLLIVFQQAKESVTLLLVSLQIACAMFERYPVNLALCGAALLAVEAVLAVKGGYSPAFLLSLAIPGGAIAASASFMGRYREESIVLQAHVKRLEDSVSDLTRATAQSQDYAKGVEEESATAERLRLTRDIHDVVGYTFTNNLIMLEAAKVMVLRNPELVLGHIESLRRNTEDGLAQIRRTLANLRRQERSGESLWRSLRKLVRVFSLSTGTKVTFEMGNVEPDELEPYHEAVYNFVQEGLINSFRHGRAKRVTLMLWDYGSEVRVALDDDGEGCPETFTPGIGIAGMRERAGSHGGRVDVDSIAGKGFRISMYLRKAADEA